MARTIEKQYRVTATLEAVSPIHVGGIGDNALVDLALARDGRGKFYIPGSSLAGVLRSWMEETEEMEKTEDPSLADRLWGPRKKNTDSNKKSNNNGHASFIFVEDAKVKLPNKTEELRDGVGIDRRLGTAADKIKFDRAILPRGSSFDLKLTVEVPPKDYIKNHPPEEGVLEALAGLMNALKAGEVYFGGAKTRGLGRVKIKKTAEIKEFNLLTPEGILASLRNQGSKRKFREATRVRPKLTFKVRWKPEGPVMVKAEPDGLTVNILPLTSAFGDKLALVLPGSSIKGALRFQGERILRTLGVPDGATEAEELPEKERFFARLELPLVKTIFGTSKKNPPRPSEDRGEEMETASNGKKPLPGLGALLVEDCYSTERMSDRQWQDIAEARDDEALGKALTKAGLKETQQAYHVAIDRWTGGAAEAMLYSNLEPFGIDWEELGLTLNLSRIPEEEWLAAIAFLLLILRDLSNDRIPLGYGVNRGFGSIEVEEISIGAEGIDDLSLPLEVKALTKGVNCPEGKIASLDRSLLTVLDEAWQNWLAINN